MTRAEFATSLLGDISKIQIADPQRLAEALADLIKEEANASTWEAAWAAWESKPKWSRDELIQSAPARMVVDGLKQPHAAPQSEP